MEIFELKDYCAELPNGQTAVVSVRVAVNNPEDIMRSGRVGLPAGPMGTIPVNFEFPSEYSLEECFEHFEEEAKEAAEEAMKEIQAQALEEKNKIVTPGSGGLSIL